MVEPAPLEPVASLFTVEQVQQFIGDVLAYCAAHNIDANNSQVDTKLIEPEIADGSATQQYSVKRGDETVYFHLIRDADGSVRNVMPATATPLQN